jgi:glycosyltransferase involved in cell wall biosynthesis
MLSERFGLDPDRCHMGVLGAPRRNKNLGLVAQGLLGSGREDVELILFSAGPSAKVPDHPRVHLRRYERVPEEDYNAQLAAIDMLLLPYGDGGSMLTSGVVADAIAVSKPVIISDWGYLTETFGDSALNYGIAADGLSSLLADLDLSTLEERANAVGTLRAKHDPGEIARQTFEMLSDVLSTDRVL